MTNAVSVKDRLKKQAIEDGEYARATMDIDLLAQRLPNDAEESIQ